MPRFRSLTAEELQEMEKEFIDFLVINGVTADQWEALKKEESEKAEGIVDAFSDMVLETILKQVHYLEVRSSHDLKTFQCGSERMTLVGLKAPAHLRVDFRDETFLQNALTQPPADLELYTTAKAYDGNREDEIFRLTEQGCVVTDGKLFKALSLALANMQ